MAANSNLPPPPIFDDEVSDWRIDIGPKWDSWIRELERFMDAAHVTDDNRKRAVLLYMLGPNTLDILLAFPDYGTDYATAKDKMSEYFNPVSENKEQTMDENIYAENENIKEEPIDKGGDDQEVTQETDSKHDLGVIGEDPTIRHSDLSSDHVEASDDAIKEKSDQADIVNKCTVNVEPKKR